MVVKDPSVTYKISTLYSKFDNASKESTNHKRLAWTDDLLMDVTENEWEESCVQVQALSINSIPVLN